MPICSLCKWHSVKMERNFSYAEKIQKEFEKAYRSFDFDAQKHHLCSRPENVQIDHVTGDPIFAECYSKNLFGECMFFEEISEDEPTEEVPDEPIEEPTDEPTEDQTEEIPEDEITE